MNCYSFISNLMIWLDLNRLWNHQYLVVKFSSKSVKEISLKLKVLIFCTQVYNACNFSCKPWQQKPAPPSGLEILLPINKQPFEISSLYLVIHGRLHKNLRVNKCEVYMKTSLFITWHWKYLEIFLMLLLDVW